MDVAGYQGRISGHLEAFLVIFCVHILSQNYMRLVVSQDFSIVFYFSIRLLEENCSGI